MSSAAATSVITSYSIHYTKLYEENLDAILDVEGIDGVFIGPADLSASLGYPDDASNPVVQAEIEKCIRRIRT